MIPIPFYTPLRYPGGKRKLNDFLKVLLEKNHLLGCQYAEPYAGGAGLALHLLFDGYVSHIYINDLNPSVFSFWNAVLNETDGLCRLISDTPVTIEEWHRQKQIQLKAEALAGSLELAFSTFFLNRTNRSGIIKGGVIGGKKQSGEWELSTRFQKTNLIDRILNIASRKSQISLFRLDALVFLDHLKTNDKANSCFAYLDPPYYRKGSGLYDNFYKPEDHAKVATYVQGLKFPWIVSYDNTPQVSELYSNFRAVTYSLNYTAHLKTPALEFMAFSNDLILPEDVFLGEASFGCMRQMLLVS